MLNAKPPRWVEREKGEMAFPALKLEGPALNALMKAHPDHPPLQNWFVSTFSKRKGGMKAKVINGPAKLFRIVDPSNEAAGVFWIAEAEFRAIKSRDEWRSRFAVKPEWNQNGWFVEYEVKAGETLNVWQGLAGSQKLEGTDYYLKGGREQIVFFPSGRDGMVEPMPRIDSDTGDIIRDGAGKPDRRVEFTSITGETVPTKLRDRITDPHIKGPIETGWGASDYTPDEARRILLTVPTAP